MGNVICPVCNQMFASKLELSLHWSHKHYGPVPAPFEGTPLVAPAQEPKAKVEETDVAPLEGAKVPVAIDSEDTYSLSESSKGLGELYPVLKDAHGNIIDGFHRKGENPNWHEAVCPQIDTPVLLALAQLGSNACRRAIPAEEKRQRIKFLIENGLKLEEIAKQTGMSLRTVQKYTPQELKNPAFVEMGKKAHPTLDGEGLHFTNVKASAELATENVPAESHGITDEAPTVRDDSVSKSNEAEPEEEKQAACPACGFLLNLADYELVKTEVGIKYGRTVQQKLFPTEAEA